MTHVLGIDISTQTISVMLASVVEESGVPVELRISGEWTESRACRDELSRKDPQVWVELVRDCVLGLKRRLPQVADVQAIGVSTAFPGCFAIGRDGSVDPSCVSLYDNSDDAGICDGSFEDVLGQAESDTLSRMWPGNMAIGLIALLKSGMKLDDAAGIVPPNTAFASALLKASGVHPGAANLFTDFTQAPIGGLYDARSGQPLPDGVRRLLERAVPELRLEHLAALLPSVGPSWRNVVPPPAVTDVRELLGLPGLNSVSIGAGDSPLGALALLADRGTVINVRGSSDSPMIAIDAPKPRSGPRETVLHYPLPSAASLNDSPWCAVAPMLRSGRVWDWVRSLRFPDQGNAADVELEVLALAAYRDTSKPRLRFDTALGGERAPLWDCSATGEISGLIESHGIGDIALAALEGMSARLEQCIRLMEERYSVRTNTLLLVGGPARNKLWNWITRQAVGKATFATTFTDASLLGAALLGYAAAYDGREPDTSIAARLQALSRLSSRHPLIAPVEVEGPA